MAARSTRLHVVCPPLVPAGGVVRGSDLSGPQVVTKDSYSVSINNGQNPGRIHWEFGAIRGPATKLWVFDRRNWAATPPVHPARLLAERHAHGYTISLYRFPENDGQLEGHDAAFATAGGVSYFVSIHGYTHDLADVAMLEAVLLSSRR